MARLSKDDLRQMNRSYFQSLSKEKLVEVANNLHILAVEQWEKINSNSSNSSQPPSADNPFQKPNSSSTLTNDISQAQFSSSQKENTVQKQQATESKQKRKPGRQKGGKGFGRHKPLKVSVTIPHYPKQCSACNQTLSATESKPYMGHYVLELETTESKLEIACQLHHYYQSTCRWLWCLSSSRTSSEMLGSSNS